MAERDEAPKREQGLAFPQTPDDDANLARRRFSVKALPTPKNSAVLALIYAAAAVVAADLFTAPKIHSICDPRPLTARASWPRLPPPKGSTYRNVPFRT
ncbi:hypothetical protein NHU_00049 [Rhodovulum sulfidophilum]|uniref:Uncharacterized protein n=1 Tax=Rhodovulum sulfidophilum TaxID=35806 RepID=A0A0D6AWY4_RHOSU|nr:hypothetical protein NHU_00049 [Rhodovulum sulfidophilum]